MQAGTRAAHGIRDGGDRFFLADHAVAEARFHVQQFRALTFLQAVHRNARPCRNDAGDVVLGDFFLEDAAVLLEAGEFFLRGLEFALHVWQLAVGDFRGAREIADSLGLLGMGLERFDFFLGGSNFIDDGLFIAPLRHQRGALFFEIRLFFFDFIEPCDGGFIGLFL